MLISQLLATLDLRWT